MSDANDVLQAVDQLRRELNGYHGQLKAHNDLQRHCDNQRKRISELEGLYAKAKDENTKLRELVTELWSLAYGYVPFETELDDARDMMRDLEIKVD